MFMEIYYDILDKKRLAAFKRLAYFSKYGPLAGGTALAMQIGHRISVDFDIFCHQEIDNKLINKTRKNFLISQVLVNNKDELTFLTKDNIKITFLYYPFKFRGKLIKTRNGPNLLGVKNIAITKAYTLGRRNSWRDYADLYFILSQRIITLSELIKLTKSVYRELFNEKLFLAQLLYTNDISKNEIKEVKIIKEEISLNQVKKYFKQQIDNYLKIGAK